MTSYQIHITNTVSWSTGDRQSIKPKPPILCRNPATGRNYQISITLSNAQKRRQQYTWFALQHCFTAQKHDRSRDEITTLPMHFLRRYSRLSHAKVSSLPSLHACDSTKTHTMDQFPELNKHYFTTRATEPDPSLITQLPFLRLRMHRVLRTNPY
jgi:hypothetical protein